VSRWADVNGRLVRTRDARVAVEDRGFLFADSVYEVFVAFNGIVLDRDAHFERLDRSLAGLRMDAPSGHAALALRIDRLLARNHVRTGLIYLQVTRGAARRDHGFPPPDTPPTRVLMAWPVDMAAKVAQAVRGVAVASQSEIRWRHRDIKATALLPNVLAKQAAREAGAFEAWFVTDTGVVTEGASTNAWIVDAQGTLVTHPDGPDILPGVMKRTLLRLARAHRIAVAERPFTLTEALGAREAFLTATTAPCLPVVQIDGKAVGNGSPGPVARHLLDLMAGEIQHQTGFDYSALVARARAVV